MKEQNTRNGAFCAAPRRAFLRPASLVLAAFLLFFGASCSTLQLENIDSAAPDRTETDVVAAARKNIGAPYRFGGYSPETGFDCSGLVSWSYAQVGVNLPRRARDQIQFGIPIQKKEELQPGDIVVFRDRRSRTGWHSGIYSGEGKFIHSPSQGRTVEEIRLDEEYYASRFAGARRVPRDGSEKAMFAAYQEKLRAQAKTPARAADGKKAASAKPAKKGKAVKAEKAAAGKHASSQRPKKVAPAKGKTAPAKGRAAPTRGQAAKSAKAKPALTHANPK
jgi:hypothetical protein